VHAMDRRLPPLVNPETARDFVYVDDVVGALRCLAQAAHIEPGEVVNVGTGRQRTLRDVVTVVQRLTAIDEEPQWGSMAPRAWDTDTWVADVSRIRERFGWTAAVSLDEGLERMWRWFEQSPQRVLQYQQRGRSAPVG
jgi:UDP-glucose 4-epimerase